MTQKLYCYVDETGQDTLGDLFIVAVLVTGKERDELERFLEWCEKQSGRGRRKWTHTRRREKTKYLHLALVSERLSGKIFYQIHRETKAYLKFTTQSVIHALSAYAGTHGVRDYKAVVIIDGLNRQGELEVSRQIRRSGVKTRAVKGGRDEASALIRLADTVAGLVREAMEADEELAKWVAKLSQERVLIELEGK